jgi:hypothetical protein
MPPPMKSRYVLKDAEVVEGLERIRDRLAKQGRDADTKALDKAIAEVSRESLVN